MEGRESRIIDTWWSCTRKTKEECLFHFITTTRVMGQPNTHYWAGPKSVLNESNLIQ